MGRNGGEEEFWISVGEGWLGVKCVSEEGLGSHSRSSLVPVYSLLFSLTHLVSAGTLVSGGGAVAAAAAAGGGEGAGSVVGVDEGASEFRGRDVV